MKHTLITFSLLLTFTAGYCQQKQTDTTFTTSDGTKLYLKVSGTGTPCIFVHGGPGAWSKSFETMKGDVLEQKLTMYYYDQRGSGRSASPKDNNFTLARMVEDIENIRVLTGQEKVYLLAHSFGGIPAFSYAQKYPQHVKGLILANATLYINNSLLNQIDFANRQLGTHFTANSTDSIIPVFMRASRSLREKGLGYKMLSDNETTVQMLDEIDNSAPRNYDFARQALGMPEYLADFTKGTGQVNVPVLVISGTTDNNIGPDHYKLFRFPNQQVKVVEGGHVLYYEKSREFAEIIWEFTGKRP